MRSRRFFRLGAELLLSPIAPAPVPVERMRTQLLKRRHFAADPMMMSDEHFEKLVTEHYESLYRFALNLTRSEFEAGDLTQHTFYTWARKGHQLRDVSKVKTWLYTTLNRAFLETRRRQVRFPHHELETVEHQLPTISPDVVDRSDSTQVRAALAKVDETFRSAVALFYLEDCPYKDIASILEVPIGTVKSRIARGLAQLREILQADMPSARRGSREEALPGAAEASCASSSLEGTAPSVA